MAAAAAAAGEARKDVYSVWAFPPEELTPRLKKLMSGLRSEFGGPEFEPHVTLVGAISLTESEARDRFKKACEGLKPYSATVEKVATGTFFYQCVFLLLHPTPEVTSRNSKLWFWLSSSFSVLSVKNCLLISAEKFVASVNRDTGKSMNFIGPISIIICRN